MSHLNSERSAAAGGFRLERAEIFNWGTFGGNRVCVIKPAGLPALMTGDMGSGKSSVADAIQTLLVPSGKLGYNKAADEKARERTLKSYVRGQYKNALDENDGKAKPVFLRGTETYTVLLAVFVNKVLKETLTIAQVHWLRTEAESPNHMYIVAERDIGIAGHFLNVEKMADLKKRLTSTDKVTVFETFEDYSRRFSQAMGIPGAQALALFTQTMAMKQVASLSSFIKDYMLDKGDVDNAVNQLIDGFNALSEAHDAVAKAEKQITLLKPVDFEAARFAHFLEQGLEKQNVANAVEAYYASIYIDLVNKRILHYEGENRRIEVKLDALENDLAAARIRAAELKDSIENAGGSRINAIESEIIQLEKIKKERKDAAESFGIACISLGLSIPHDADAHQSVIENAKIIGDRLKDTIEQNESQRIDLGVVAKELEERRIGGIQQELESLREHRNSIPFANLKIRKAIADALGVPIERLPFAGELIEVKPEASDWEGAAERILHNFALSVLVPDDLYRQVNRYVNRTHLGGKLVYHKVVKTNAAATRLDERSLTAKLELRRDYEFRPWLANYVEKRFDLVCCDNDDEFINHPDAIMRSGLFKTRGDRHEKDDRHHVNDRSRYVLGWNNQRKIDTLAEQLKAAQNELKAVIGQINDLRTAAMGLATKREATLSVMTVGRFETIDWQSVARRMDTLADEKRRIEESSDVLRQLKHEKEANEQSIHDMEIDSVGLKADIKANIKLIDDHRAQHIPEKQAIVDGIRTEERDDLFAKVAEAAKQWSDQTPAITIQNAMLIGRDQKNKLSDQARSSFRSAEDHKLKLRDAIDVYRRTFPVEGQDIDPDERAVPELRKALKELVDDGLPRHLDRFREQLRTHTFQGLVALDHSLNQCETNIRKRLDQINASLKGLDYGRGTYIEIIRKGVADEEVKTFRADLKACFAGSLDENAIYTEDRFKQVRNIVVRLKNRGQEYANIDREWREKVTDVRRWFDFSAHEKFRETGAVHCVYEGSGGRSGGQKERLAYTVLAAALAYQFNTTKEKSFRFVIVDEAFGRGSDDNACYGMELFNELGLQLLVLTPLQKINVISRFVDSVNFVQNNADGNASAVVTMSIEEVEAKRHALLNAVKPLDEAAAV